jgi:hypothetical protein
MDGGESRNKFSPPPRRSLQRSQPAVYQLHLVQDLLFSYSFVIFPNRRQDKSNRIQKTRARCLCNKLEVYVFFSSNYSPSFAPLLSSSLSRRSSSQFTTLSPSNPRNSFLVCLLVLIPFVTCIALPCALWYSFVLILSLSVEIREV